MTQSEIYDRGDMDHAVDEALDILEGVFETHYVDTQTPVHHAETEMSNWFFQWDSGGEEYRFEVDLHNGNFWLMRKVDGEWKNLVSTR